MCGSNLDAGQLVSVSASQLEKASRLAEDENSGKENGDKVHKKFNFHVSKTTALAN
jgi:hypothetical protein